MKVLVLGAAGQVASAVFALAPKTHVVVRKLRSELDMTSEGQLDAELSANRYDWIVNGAAYTAVDLAEKEPNQARLVNDTAVGCLARAAERTGTRLFHLSTDFVFDGRASTPYRPTDPTGPLSAYGATKLGGEQQILALAGAAIIARTAWVYASTGRNFVLTMLRLMREREEVRVVSDQIGSPTWAPGIAQMIWGFIDAGAAPGVYHWTDLGVASWYDFAVAIQEEALIRGVLTRSVPVIPIPTTAYPTPAVRPSFSVLDSETARIVVPSLARHWRHNLRKMLDELRAA